MKTMQWTYMDKSAWLEGPWKTEIDKEQWMDARTNLPCLIRRNPLGVLCGYVAVGPSHPLFEKHYNTCSRYFDVHGGVTFSDFCADSEDDPSAICHIVEPGDPDRVWWFGFHCANAFDYSPAPTTSAVAAMLYSTKLEDYRDFAYVKNECLSLSFQLEGFGTLDNKIVEHMLDHDSE